jgi:hypothetical protein
MGGSHLQPTIFPSLFDFNYILLECFSNLFLNKTATVQSVSPSKQLETFIQAASFMFSMADPYRYLTLNPRLPSIACHRKFEEQKNSMF